MQKCLCCVSAMQAVRAINVEQIEGKSGKAHKRHTALLSLCFFVLGSNWIELGRAGIICSISSNCQCRTRSVLLEHELLDDRTTEFISLQRISSPCKYAHFTSDVTYCYTSATSPNIHINRLLFWQPVSPFYAHLHTLVLYVIHFFMSARFPASVFASSTRAV